MNLRCLTLAFLLNSCLALAVTIKKDGTLVFSFDHAFHTHNAENLLRALQSRKVSVHEKKRLIFRILLDPNMPRHLADVPLQQSFINNNPELIPATVQALATHSDVRTGPYLQRKGVLPVAVEIYNNNQIADASLAKTVLSQLDAKAGRQFNPTLDPYNDQSYVDTIKELTDHIAHADQATREQMQKSGTIDRFKAKIFPIFDRIIEARHRTLRGERKNAPSNYEIQKATTELAAFEADLTSVKASLAQIEASLPSVSTPGCPASMKSVSEVPET